MVNQPDKDALILFYSPSCPHCKKLEPVYRELAGKVPSSRLSSSPAAELLTSNLSFTVVCQLEADPNLVVVKMNAVDNDVPLGYDVRG